MLLERYASEDEVVQHWERIIAALQGSQLAKIWHVFKLNAAQEVPSASSEARDFHDEGQEPNHKRTKSTVHADS